MMPTDEGAVSATALQCLRALLDHEGLVAASPRIEGAYEPGENGRRFVSRRRRVHRFLEIGFGFSGESLT